MQAILCLEGKCLAWEMAFLLETPPQYPCRPFCNPLLATSLCWHQSVLGHLLSKSESQTGSNWLSS
nr:hypothetical protein Itr_chr10CG12080 [Ipomoea trifida]